MSKIDNNTLPEIQPQSGQKNPERRTDDQRWKSAENLLYELKSFTFDRLYNLKYGKEPVTDEEFQKITEEYLVSIKKEWEKDGVPFPESHETRARELAQKLANGIRMRIQNRFDENRKSMKDRIDSATDIRGLLAFR